MEKKGSPSEGVCWLSEHDPYVDYWLNLVSVSDPYFASDTYSSMAFWGREKSGIGDESPGAPSTSHIS